MVLKWGGGGSAYTISRGFLELFFKTITVKRNYPKRGFIRTGMAWDAISRTMDLLAG